MIAWRNEKVKFLTDTLHWQKDRIHLNLQSSIGCQLHPGQDPEKLIAVAQLWALWHEAFAWRQLMIYRDTLYAFRCCAGNDIQRLIYMHCWSFINCNLECTGRGHLSGRIVETNPSAHKTSTWLNLYSMLNSTSSTGNQYDINLGL